MIQKQIKWKPLCLQTEIKSCIPERSNVNPQNVLFRDSKCTMLSQILWILSPLRLCCGQNPAANPRSAVCCRRRKSELMHQRWLDCRDEVGDVALEGKPELSVRIWASTPLKTVQLQTAGVEVTGIVALMASYGIPSGLRGSPLLKENPASYGWYF